MRFPPLVRFAAPSAAVALSAGAVAGLVEGALEGAALPEVLCAAGAAVLYVAPLGFLLSLALRGLWREWRPLIAPGADADADGTIVFGGAVYAVLAAVALGGAGFGLSRLALVEGPSGSELSRPAIAAGLAVAAAALLAASRPAVVGLAHVGRALGLRGPRRALAAAAVMAGILAAALWFGVLGPALARIDYGYAGYAWTAVAVLVLGHAGARRLERPGARVVAGAAAAVLGLSLVAATLAVRLRHPAILFDAWYRMPVGGLAIGFTYDIDDLRSRSLPYDVAPRPRPGVAHPDLVLLTIDTVRADQLRLHGGSAVTPRIEAVARRGVVFEWAFAPSNNTRQSVSSMMTGLSPARLRGRVIEFGLKLDPRHILLAERLRAAGYATAGFLCCINHMGGRKKIGLDRGLESVAYARGGARLADLAEEWLRATAGSRRPRYLWVHFFEPHDWQRQFPSDPGRFREAEPAGHAAPAAPPAPPRPWSAGAAPEAASRYRQSVEHTDRLLVPLLEALEAGGRPTILVIASDHGEGLGDHRALHHASNLYNSQIRVPLVIAGPDLGPPRRVGAPVALLDLAPTLLDLAGFEPPGMPEMDGRSFADLLRGQEWPPAAREAYAVMVRDRSVARSGRALVAGRYKLISVEGRPLELYDLTADPGETRSLARNQPALAADLAARLERRRASDAVAPF